MPTNHRTNFDKKKCPDSADTRRRIPGCTVGVVEKPFVPQTRFAFVPQNTSKEIAIPPIAIPGNGNTFTFSNDNTFTFNDNTFTNQFSNGNGNDNDNDNVNGNTFSNEMNVNEFSNGNAFRMPRINLRPNTAELSAEEMNKARMVRVSKTYYKEGLLAAQSEIDRSTLRGWHIDNELTNEEGVVLRKGAEGKVAYRGTDWSNIQDIVNNAGTAVGAEQMTSQIQEGKIQIEKYKAKFGTYPNELLGYSKGGAGALHIGDNFKIPTTTFNPFIGKNQLTSKSEVKHNIIRTVEDVPSTPLALAKKSNYSVKSIDPIRGLGGLKSTHDLKNFTSTGPRQPGHLETHLIESVQKGNQLAQLETLDAMRTGVEQGKTFTETLDAFNQTNGTSQRVDVTAEGKLGPRIHSQAGTVKLWKAAGGKMTNQEQSHLNAAEVPPARVFSAEAQSMGIGQELTSAQISHVVNKSPQQRHSFMQDQRNEMKNTMNEINESVKPHEQVIKALMPKPSSMATGAIAGVGAHAIMNVIDPQHKLNNVVSEATEGAIAGAAGVGISASLGASAALGPEMLAGAASYAAGAESAKLIKNALVSGGMDTNTAEGIGSVSGGAIGGVTASATATGATVLGSLAFGAELGESIGAVGGPIGIAIGAAAGATIGAIVGGIGYLVGAHNSPPPPPPPDQIIGGEGPTIFGANSDMRDAYTKHIDALQDEEDRRRDALESFGREQYTKMKKLDPTQDWTLQGQIEAGHITKDGGNVMPTTERAKGSNSMTEIFDAAELPSGTPNVGVSGVSGVPTKGNV